MTGMNQYTSLNIMTGVYQYTSLNIMTGMNQYMDHDTRLQWWHPEGVMTMALNGNITSFFKIIVIIKLEKSWK